jgi:hypothetical protein
MALPASDDRFEQELMRWFSLYDLQSVIPSQRNGHRDPGAPSQRAQWIASASGKQ